MTKAEKAIAVAKDVLLQIRLGKITAYHGVYIQGEFEQVDGGYDANLSCDLRDVKLKKCSVCAMGAAVMSYARLYDRTPARNILRTDGLSSRWVFSESRDRFASVLSKILPKRDIELMETAFEQSDINCDCSTEKKSIEVKAAELYGESLADYDNDTKSLIGVMRNIIRNKGRFKVPQKFYGQAKRVLFEEEDDSY